MKAKRQDVTQNACKCHVASGAGRKAKGWIVAIKIFFLAPHALSLEPFVFEQFT